MDNSELLQHSKKWDRTGIVVSSLCLIHCLGLPFIVAVIPALHSLLENPLIEVTIFSLAILIGAISFLTSYKQHKKVQPMIIGLIGIVFLLTNLYQEMISDHHEHTHHLEDGFLNIINPFMVIGGLLLVSGHIWNLYACHCFCDQSCSHEEHQSQDHKKHSHSH